jgi:hypothetical protein
MRLSLRGSIYSILIASVLLLSATVGALKPSPRPTPKPHESTQFGKEERQQQTTPIRATDAPQPPQETATPAAEHNGATNASTEWTAAATLISALAALAIAWFNWRLVGVTDEMKKATAEAAKAAAKSAEAANFALKSDRPYLILERAELTGVLRGDNPVFPKEPLQLDELTMPPRFNPRLVMTFRNYGRGPVIFREGLIRIEALRELPPPRDFSGCTRMGLRANAISAGDEWHPLAEFNFEADWTALFPDIAAGRKRLIAYGCVRYTDPIGNDIYETGFGWIFIPPRIEFIRMPKRAQELLAPYRAPSAPDPQTPIPTKTPGYFARGPKTHNYND